MWLLSMSYVLLRLSCVITGQILCYYTFMIAQNRTTTRKTGIMAAPQNIISLALKIALRLSESVLPMIHPARIIFSQTLPV